MQLFLYWEFIPFILVSVDPKINHVRTTRGSHLAYSSNSPSSPELVELVDGAHLALVAVVLAERWAGAHPLPSLAACS